MAWAADSFWQPVGWDTPDGIRLVGRYHPASDTSKLTWVLQHGLGSTKEEWDGLGRAAGAAGMGVLIFDARGHGQSTKTSGGDPLNYRDFSLADWRALPGDMTSAVDFLEKRFHRPSGSIAVGGASLGANTAVLCAAYQKDIPAILLLSPGMEYAGLSIENAASRLAPRPTLLAASPGDGYAFHTVQTLARRLPAASVRLVPGEGSTHGVQMLNPETTGKVVDWMKGIGAR